MSEISIYSTDMFVFVDETGSDHRNTLRKRSYSLRGLPLKDHTLFVRGERLSAIACMSTRGLLDVKIVHGTSDGDTFYEFVNNHLLQQLLPFNGTNDHSIVILDNCTIHHIVEVSRMINEIRALVIYLPPYSPDLNPIELLFSKVKTAIKSIDMHSSCRLSNNNH